MSTTEMYDIPEHFREKLVVNMQNEDNFESQNEVERYSTELEQEAYSGEILEGDKSKFESEIYNGEIPDGGKSEFESESEENYEEAVEVMMRPCRGERCRRPNCRHGRCHHMPYPNYPYHPCPMGGLCRNPDRVHRPVPYYQAYPGALRIQENAADEIDMDKMKERYPKTARRIQEYVEEAADRMDYDGSMMFDEYPDQVRIDKLVNEIYDNMFANESEMDGETNICKEEKEIIKELIMVLLFQQMYLKRCNNRKCKEWW